MEFEGKLSESQLTGEFETSRGVQEVTGKKMMRGGRWRGGEEEKGDYRIGFEYLAQRSPSLDRVTKVNSFESSVLPLRAESASLHIAAVQTCTRRGAKCLDR